MPICGSTCTLTGITSGHRFVLELGANETDVRTFGDGRYGSYITCAKNGTLTVDTYARPDLDTGDSVVCVAEVGTESFTIPIIVTRQTINVDAKDIVQFTTIGRVVSAVGIETI